MSRITQGFSGASGVHTTSNGVSALNAALIGPETGRLPSITRTSHPAGFSPSESVRTCQLSAATWRPSSLASEAPTSLLLPEQTTRLVDCECVAGHSVNAVKLKI